MLPAFFSILAYAIPYIKLQQVFASFLNTGLVSLGRALCLAFMVFISIYRLKWIRCQGTVYRLAQFVLSGWQDDDLPQFSKIEQLISIQNVAIMVAIHYHTVGIDRHYHSYLIGSTRCKSVIPLANVDSHPPVNVRALPSGMYLTLCYHVLNVSCTSV